MKNLLLGCLVWRLQNECCVKGRSPIQSSKRTLSAPSCSWGNVSKNWKCTKSYLKTLIFPFMIWTQLVELKRCHPQVSRPCCLLDHIFESYYTVMTDKYPLNLHTCQIDMLSSPARYHRECHLSVLTFNFPMNLLHLGHMSSLITSPDFFPSISFSLVYVTHVWYNNLLNDIVYLDTWHRSWGCSFPAVVNIRST